MSTSRQNKPRLTDEAILTGADGFVPTPRRQLIPVSPFLEDDENGVAISLPKDEGDADLGSNTSSSSSDEEDQDPKSSGAASRDSSKRLAKVPTPPSTGKRKPSNLPSLTEVDLGGADPAPSMFSPAAGAKVPVSPFLDAPTSSSKPRPAVAQSRASPASGTPIATDVLRRTVLKGSTSLGNGSPGTKRTEAGRLSETRTPPPAPPSSHAKTGSSAGSVGTSQRGAVTKPVALRIDLTSSAKKVSSRPGSAQKPPITKPVQAPSTSSSIETFASPLSASIASNSNEWSVERRELQTRARRAEKKLALALLTSATHRRKQALMRYYLRQWKQASAKNVPAEDDAQILADELLKRLKALRGEFN